MMAAFNFGKTFGSVKINAAFFVSLLSLNFLFEIAICAFVAPIVTTGLRVALRIDKKGRRSDAAPSAAQEEPSEDPAETSEEDQ